MKVYEQILLIIFVVMSFVFNIITKIPLTHNITIIMMLYLLSLTSSIFILKRYKKILISPLLLLNFVILFVYYYFKDGNLPYHIYGFLGAIIAIMLTEYMEFSKESKL